MSTCGAYAVLNDFVAPESPGVTVRRPFRSPQTVKDVLEAMGITHTKVDLIRVNGDAVGFPTGRPLATVSPHTRCSSARHRVHGPAAAGAAAHPRFVVDVNLGRLARLLRVGRVVVE